MKAPSDTRGRRLNTATRQSGTRTGPERLRPPRLALPPLEVAVVGLGPVEPERRSNEAFRPDHDCHEFRAARACCIVDDISILDEGIAGIVGVPPAERIGTVEPDDAPLRDGDEDRARMGLPAA